MLEYGNHECYVMHMLYVCVLCASFGSSQCCVLHDLQIVDAGRGYKRRPQQNSNHTQTLLNMQHTRQTDPLTEQRIKYKDTTSHSPQLRSKRQ